MLATVVCEALARAIHNPNSDLGDGGTVQIPHTFEHLEVPVQAIIQGEV